MSKPFVSSEYVEDSEAWWTWTEMLNLGMAASKWERSFEPLIY